MLLQSGLAQLGKLIARLGLTQQSTNHFIHFIQP